MRGGFLSGGLREVPAVLRPLPNRVRLSWSCSTLQSFHRGRLAPHGLGAPLVPFAPPGWAPGVSSATTAGKVRQNRTGASLMGFCSPSESFGLQAAAAPSRPSRVRSAAMAPPMRFVAPSAFPRTRQQPDGRVCLARPLASSGFRNLSTPRSATCLPALSHAGSAHGVTPFRAFLLPRSRTPSPAPTTLMALDGLG